MLGVEDTLYVRLWRTHCMLGYGGHIACQVMEDTLYVRLWRTHCMLGVEDTLHVGCGGHIVC